MLRTGRSMVITADDRLVLADGPDVYGTVVRHGSRVDWWISYGPAGKRLASGRTWTQGGAWVEATAAAHGPLTLSRRSEATR